MIATWLVNKFLISILNVCDSIDNKVATLTISANIITNLLDDDRIYSSTVVEEGKKLIWLVDFHGDKILLNINTVQ